MPALPLSLIPRVTHTRGLARLPACGTRDEGLHCISWAPLHWLQQTGGDRSFVPIRNQPFSWQHLQPLTPALITLQEGLLPFV